MKRNAKKAKEKAKKAHPPDVPEYEPEDSIGDMEEIFGNKRKAKKKKKPRDVHEELDWVGPAASSSSST